MGAFCLRALPLFLLLAASDPWTPTELISPAHLAPQLGSALVIQVGFAALYHGAHITGSTYAGPASKPEGLEALRNAVAREPRDRMIVLYCGCCPWDHCPNIRPAFAALKGMGFTHVRALEIPTNLKTDWVDHGYPTERGERGGG
jgi:thiosulfate/3-mercaptopyruvate sulfurtransferase